MEPITEIGQAVVHLQGKDLFFNPSFLAMTRIGSPEEIIDYFVKVHGGHYPQNIPSNPHILKIVQSTVYGKDVLSAAVIIAQACCEEDIGYLVGGYKFTSRGKLVYQKGFMPITDVITLSQHLIKHGVVGEQMEPSGESDGEYSTRFDAKSFVYSAVAHLGMSEIDAWNMTMTSFTSAIKAKFPQKEKPKIPSQQDYDDTMNWADQILKRDADKRQNH